MVESTSVRGGEGVAVEQLVWQGRVSFLLVKQKLTQEKLCERRGCQCEGAGTEKPQLVGLSPKSLAKECINLERCNAEVSAWCHQRTLNCTPLM